MSGNRRIIIALLFFLLITAIGTAGFVIIEGYSLLDGLYMTVITLSTVGFGEVKPLSGAGRAFASLFIMLSLAGLAFATHALVETLLEKAWTGKLEMKKMKKQISRLKSHYIMCGYGRMGAAAAEYFEKAGTSFVIVESHPEQIQRIRETDRLFIEGDATHESTLLDAGIKSASGLLALLKSDPDNLFLVLTARELNPTLHIIARAEEESSGKKIFRAGADSVISPFATAGKQIASDILTATGRFSGPVDQKIRPGAKPQWIAVQADSDMLGQNIGMVSSQTEGQVVGLRRNGSDILLPDPDTPLESGDMILVMEGSDGSGNRVSFHRTEPKKIVIVDDNPIILRLYTRLFQKAGFNPLPATNGREGLDTIVREKPVAAVIDFMLPVLSGIEVCQKVRSVPGCKGTKLILFTADDQPETRNRALKAGADAVVVKSPEASEVIETVLQMLKEN